jgi:hypothetical protein
VPRQNSDLLSNHADEFWIQFGQSPSKTGLVLRQLRSFSTLPFRFFCSRRDLVLENLVLRQQLTVLWGRRQQPRLSAHDRLFWFVA